MSILKPKIFLPLCLAGVLTGYTAAEYIVPKYFHPTAETKLTPDDIFAAIGAQPNYFRQTKSGNYLAGQFAQRHKDWDKAAQYMNGVIKREADDGDLIKSAMILSMAAGDAPDAVKMAKEVLQDDPNNILAVLFKSLNDLKSKDYNAALATYNKIEENNIAAFIVPVLKLWAKSGKGEFDVSTLSENSFYAYQAMLVGAYLKKPNEALEYAAGAFNLKENDVRDLEKYADTFLAYGKVDKALDIYKVIEEKKFATDSVLDKIDRLENSKAFEKQVTLPPITSPAEGAAYVFQDMAEILLREFSDDSATIFAQMALYLDPKLYKNHAIIGEVFARNERYDDAIEAYQKIGKESDLYIESQRMVAELYSIKEDDEKAIKILESLYKTSDDYDALIQIGDIHRYEENYASAKETYDKVLNILSDENGEVPEKYWHVYYARGMALERLKEFEAAEADLQKALEFRPENPYLLNYLGYSWVDQGIKLDESLDMIMRAVSYKPNDGYITDSLGWAFYKRGDYKASVPHLERAVELLPYDPTINDHLGDAYWMVGRKNEARFQWQRALNFNEDEDLELKASIERKFKHGVEKEEAPVTIQADDSKAVKSEKQKDL